MKKLLTIVVALVVVAVIAGLSVNHYKNYQNKQKAQAPKVVSVQEADQKIQNAVAAGNSAYGSLVVQYNKAVAECQKGVIAYAKLTSTLKIQTASPVCPAPKS